MVLLGFWGCFSGDFFIFSLTKIPFGKYVLFFWGFLSKSTFLQPPAPLTNLTNDF